MGFNKQALTGQVMVLDQDQWADSGPRLHILFLSLDLPFLCWINLYFPLQHWYGHDERNNHLYKSNTPKISKG